MIIAQRFPIRISSDSNKKNDTACRQVSKQTTQGKRSERGATATTMGAAVTTATAAATTITTRRG